MHASSPSLVLSLLAAAALIGCENADSEKGVYWNGTPSKPAATQPATPQQPAAQSGGSSQPAAQSGGSSQPSAQSGGSTQPSATSGSGQGSAGDAVPFSSLRWSYGGVNGSGAQPSDVVISGLSCSRNGLSFRYNRNLSAWGLSYANAHALACLFVQKSDGSWVGGKFDWISSSRTTRDFVNIRGGYNGWSLSGVPNPCRVAFVIIDEGRRRRSNVISATWSR